MLLVGGGTRTCWFVTPKIGGTHELLRVRPVLIINELEYGSVVKAPVESDATATDYTLTMHVTVPRRWH
jgi:hypothetical protein